MIEDNYNDDIELLDEPEVVDAGDGTLYEHWKIEVDPGQTPVRIDKFLSEKNPYQSRNRIQNAADAGFIHVNGKPVKSNYKVRPNDVITLMLDRPKHDTSIVAEDIPLNIVYEDDALMVVNKEAGMVVHPGAGNFTGTLKQKAHKCQCQCGFTGTSLAYQAQGSTLFQRQSNTVNGIHCLQIGFINYAQVLNL